MTVDELLNPQHVSQLMPEEARRLLLPATAFVMALAARAGTESETRPAAPAAPDALLTMPEVAKALKIPESKVRELGRRGELPTVTIGKYVRVRLTDLQQWVDRRVLPLVISLIVSGLEFRRLRNRLGVSQAELAEQMGTTPASVSRWEAGERPVSELVARFLRLLVQTQQERPGGR